LLSNRPSSKRTNLAIGAVQSAVAALASLPDSEEKRRLLADAESCTRAIESWPDRPPTGDEREATMKRVLGLHVGVASLERQAAARGIVPDPEPSPTSDERPTGVPPFDANEYARASEALLRAQPASSDSNATAQPMRDAFDNGQLEEALLLARSLLDATPVHAEARLIATKCTEALEQTYEAELGSMARVPVLAVTEARLRRFTLDEAELAVLRCLDGVASTASVLQRSGLPRLVSLRSLAGLCRRGVVLIRR